MDEPTAALDRARRGPLGRTLRRLATGNGGQARGLLMVTHDVEFARAHVDRVAILAEGCVVEAGPPAEVLEQPRHPATRALLAESAPCSPRCAPVIACCRPRAEHLSPR